MKGQKPIANPEEPVKLGYIRLSRDDAASMSIDNQRAALLEYDPTMTIFVDNGVSGGTNLTSPTSAWTTQLLPALAANPAAQVCVYTQDRIGRRKGKVLSAFEDIADGGGALYIVREKRLIDDPEKFDQAVNITLRSLADESYRVEGSLKTQVAIDALKGAGVKLGRKPTLTDKDVAAIRDLHERGLGYTAIGKIVRTKRQGNGEWQNKSPRTIKGALDGSLISREEWDRLNTIARLSMLGASSRK